MKAIWIRRIYRILLTAALIVAGACLIGGALHIFYSGGEQIYTLEKIGKVFRTFSVAVYIALALTLGSFILEWFLPAPRKRKPEKNHELILKNLQERANLEQCTDQDLCKTIRSLRRQRKWLSITGMVLLGICSVIFLVYALRGENYPPLAASAQDPGIINRAMVQSAIVWALCLAVPFAFGVVAAYLKKSGIKTEIDLLRHVALGKKPPATVTRDYTVQLRIIRIALLSLAVVLIVVGAIGEGWRDVLGKAAQICTECIGLG